MTGEDTTMGDHLMGIGNGRSRAGAGTGRTPAAVRRGVPGRGTVRTVSAVLAALVIAGPAVAPDVRADPAGSTADVVAGAGGLLTDDRPAPMPAPGATTIYPDPLPDPFYRASPAELAGLRNGEILRVRPVTLPAFFGYDSRQYAFRSTDTAGRPILATTLVIRPPGVRPGNKILSYQHFINGLSPRCSPGNTLQHPSAEAVTDQGLALLRMSLSRGSVVNIPDHLGPNSSYVAGHLSGHIVLDSLRAVTAEPGQGLQRSPIALLGYSGGGLATGWAAAMAADYAPELAIVGAAQGGVPTDLMAMADGLGDRRHPVFGLAFASAIALSREYPGQLDLVGALSPLGLHVMRTMTNACQLGIVRAGYQLGLGDVAPGVDVHTHPGLADAYRDNSLDLYPPVPRVPVFMWHARGDQLVPYDTAIRTARRYCVAGTPMRFVTAGGTEHMLAALEKGPEVISWIEARFRGEPEGGNCGTF